MQTWENDRAFAAAVERVYQQQQEDITKMFKEPGVNPQGLEPQLRSRETIAAEFQRQIAIWMIPYGEAGYNPNAIHPVTGQRRDSSSHTST
jgi:hypothetical protein